MKMKENGPSGPRQEALKIISSNSQRIIDDFVAFSRKFPSAGMVQDVMGLGGITNMAKSLDRIADLANGETEKIGPRNAQFVVALLNIERFRGFILRRFEGQLTHADLYEIKEEFENYL